jgi:hypothetical protein
MHNPSKVNQTKMMNGREGEGERKYEKREKKHQGAVERKLPTDASTRIGQVLRLYSRKTRGKPKRRPYYYFTVDVVVTPLHQHLPLQSHFPVMHHTTGRTVQVSLILIECVCVSVWAEKKNTIMDVVNALWDIAFSCYGIALSQLW